MASPTKTPITVTVIIQAPASFVWTYLTDIQWMKQWMMEEKELEIRTDWLIGNPLIIRGELHGLPFENTGTVLHYETGKQLTYTHLSSISRLAPKPENFCTLDFCLHASADQTRLTLTITGSPTDSVYKHMEFYWRGTLPILKACIEHQQLTAFPDTI